MRYDAASRVVSVVFRDADRGQKEMQPDLETVVLQFGVALAPQPVLGIAESADCANTDADDKGEHHCILHGSWTTFIEQKLAD